MLPQRTVILLHTLPDGEAHFDWLIDRGNGGPMLTFRTAERPDSAAVSRLSAELLPDHRREYLEYEGPVSGGRGEVSRIASGTVESLSERENEVVVVVRFGGRSRRWQGLTETTAGRHWTFREAPNP